MIPNYNDFAEEWQAAWNAHDLDRIMAHYSDDIIFRSRKAFAHLGVGELRGKDQLRRYWAGALEKQPDLRFQVLQVLGGHKMAVLVYTNHHQVTAAETLYLRTDGLVEMAAACHQITEAAPIYRLQVDLWIRPGAESAFRAHEARAVAAMVDYGGQLVEISRPETGADERHILEFPTELAFDAYRKSAATLEAQLAREACIAKTEIKVLTP